MMNTQRFRYQVSTTLLISGLLCLLFILTLVTLGVISGVTPHPVWWIITLALTALAAFTAYVIAQTRRLGPFEVTVHPDHVLVPKGFSGQHQRADLTALGAIRIIGRTSMTERKQLREGLYLLHGTDYTLLISDLFDDTDAYLTCRRLICRHARTHNPDLRVERDGAVIDDILIL